VEYFFVSDQTNYTDPKLFEERFHFWGCFNHAGRAVCRRIGHLHGEAIASFS